MPNLIKLYTTNCRPHIMDPYVDWIIAELLKIYPMFQEYDTHSPLMSKWSLFSIGRTKTLNANLTLTMKAQLLFY